MRRFFKWLGLGFLGLILVIAGPIAYTETMCRGEALPQSSAQYVTEPEWQRAEARTFLTYPEWHIVYAYEGYAEAIKTGAPHRFPYISAITGFWSSLCALTKEADKLGEAGTDAKLTIYTIGASFTLEMAFKGLYEETIGRVISWSGDSTQDAVEAAMAKDYATFLQEVPWYKYNFDAWTTQLWDQPVEGLRSWERRIALGLEWKAKAAYGRIIAQAVGALGADELRLRMAMSGAEIDQIESHPETFVLTENDVFIVETPRYRRFTRMIDSLARQAPDIQIAEIAGNDDILLSYLGETAPDLPSDAIMISRTSRPGFNDYRYLISTKVSALASTLRALHRQRGGLEHIYDY